MLLIDLSVFYSSTCALRLTDFTTCNVIVESFQYADAHHQMTFGFGHMLLIDFSVLYIVVLVH